MKILLIVVLLTSLVVGCSELPAPQPEHEWFIFVGAKLSLAVHLRFADELPTFVERFALPKEVVHVIDSLGIVSFSIVVPAANQLEGTDVARDLEEATAFFIGSIHLEGYDECRLDLDSVQYVMKGLRTTDHPPRVILLGSKRPFRYIDFGCECENAPHSLLNEFFAKRFHPEYTAPTRSEIDRKKNYGF